MIRSWAAVMAASVFLRVIRCFSDQVEETHAPNISLALIIIIISIF